MKKYIGLLICCALISCGNQKDSGAIKPKVTSITESVYASMTLRPQLSYKVQPTYPGIISEIFVEEGDTVSQGTPLFRIATSVELKNRLTNATLGLEEAQANFKGQNNLLNNIFLEIQTAKQKLVLDSTNYKRQERLWGQNIGKKIELERAKLAYEATKNQIDLLEQQYKQALNNLENNYKKAMSLTHRERSQLADYITRSEIKGTVYAINKEVGEFIGTQESFGEVGSRERFILHMDVDEVDVTKISLADTVIVSMDAYPDDTFAAKTTKIYPKKNPQTQTFLVEAQFIVQPPKLYNGLSGEANIIVGKRDGALVIPSAYLKAQGRVLTEDGERQVTVGIKNLEFVEILSGLDSNTTLIKPEQ